MSILSLFFPLCVSIHLTLRNEIGGAVFIDTTLRQADHCNQGWLFKDKSQRTFASKTVFCTTIYRRY